MPSCCLQNGQSWCMIVIKQTNLGWQNSREKVFRDKCFVFGRSFPYIFILWTLPSLQPVRQLFVWAGTRKATRQQPLLSPPSWFPSVDQTVSLISAALNKHWHWHFCQSNFYFNSCYCLNALFHHHIFFWVMSWSLLLISVMSHVPVNPAGLVYNRS